MFQATEHNHSEHVLTFEDLYLMVLNSWAMDVWQEHRDYLLGRSYGLTEEDADWWSKASLLIRWSDIHADAYGVNFCTLLEIGNYKYPPLASKVVTQCLVSKWSMKRLAIFLIEKSQELNEFVTEAYEKKYPWGYIKSIIDEYDEIHAEYWMGSRSITTFCELSYYRPHTVMAAGNELEAICQQAIDANAKSVEDYRKGKVVAIKQLIGQVMKLSKGKADPNTATEILKRLLS